MLSLGHITLRDRMFRVTRAEVTLLGGYWCVEIETEFENFDGERWAPYLYHQGLRISAGGPEDLENKSTSWRTPSGPEYPHPELGTLYVFGHQDVRNCTLTFGKYEGGHIEVEWTGACDIFGMTSSGTMFHFDARVRHRRKGTEHAS